MNGRIAMKWVYPANGTDKVPAYEYFLDGRKVSEKEYRKNFPEQAGAPMSTATYPQTSLAVGVHPRQAEETRQHARKNGVNIDVRPDGKVVFNDRSQKRAYMKLIGAHDNNAYGRV